MKTYNGKTISKKYIQSVIRTKNSTNIYTLYHHIYGGKVDSCKVYDFIKEFAPTQELESSAWSLTLGQERRVRWRESYDIRNEREYHNANIKHEVLTYFKEQLEDVKSPYAKRPMMGHTHLYFCSPVYGHSDYNKWRAMPLEGNERFCGLLVQLANKYFK